MTDNHTFKGWNLSWKWHRFFSFVFAICSILAFFFGSTLSVGLFISISVMFFCFSVDVKNSENGKEKDDSCPEEKRIDNISKT